MAKLAQLGLVEVQPGGLTSENAKMQVSIIGYLLTQTDLPDPDLVDQILMIFNNMVSLLLRK